MLGNIKEIVCHGLYRHITNLMFKCRAKSYAVEIEKIAHKELAIHNKAFEYDRIMSKKEDLFYAANTLKKDAENAKSERDFLQQELANLVNENAQFKEVIYLLCVYHLSKNHVELFSLLDSLSKELNILEESNV